MSIDRSKLATATPDSVLAAEDLSDPAVRREYERFGPRYELINSILKARKDRGWTQTQLAKAAGTSQPAIARLESGDHDPRWSTAVRVCQVLGIPLAIGDGTRLAG